MSERNLKEVIIALLQETHLLSAGAILKILSTQGKNYNKTSVYRALEQLETENAICRHHFTENESKYELREHHHAHLVCTSCGKVDTTECTYAEPKELGSFKADHHHTTVFGVCGNCQ